jgi:hypothetical protein
MEKVAKDPCQDELRQQIADRFLSRYGMKQLDELGAKAVVNFEMFNSGK